MKIPVAVKLLNEATGPKANVEFMDVSTPEKIFKSVVLSGQSRYDSRLQQHIRISPGSKQKQQQHLLFFNRSSEVII